MRNPGGYGVLIAPQAHRVNLDGLRCEAVAEGQAEFDTFTCGHCGRVTHVMPKEDPANIGGLCKGCMKLVCPHCVGKGCSPLEKRIQQMEEADYIRRQYAMLGG